VNGNNKISKIKLDKEKIRVIVAQLWKRATLYKQLLPEQVVEISILVNTSGKSLDVF
jgi:hypothetical protein